MRTICQFWKTIWEIKLCRVTCARALSCEGAVGLSREVYRSNTGYLWTQSCFWLPSLCSHNTAWNYTVLVKMQNYPQFSKKIKSDEIYTRKTQTLMPCLTMCVIAHFSLWAGVPHLCPLWSRESWNRSWICLGAGATSPQECRDAKRGQQPSGLRLHQKALVKALITKFLMNKQGINLAAGPKPSASRCATYVRHRGVTAQPEPEEHALAIR